MIKISGRRVILRAFFARRISLMLWDPSLRSGWKWKSDATEKIVIRGTFYSCSKDNMRLPFWTF